jgi:ketosteroid isomerase-like protein
MKRSTVAALMLFAVNPAFSQDPDDVRALLESYIALFNSGDSARIAEDIYAAPVQSIGPNGQLAATTTDEIEDRFELVLEEIRGRGWTHSIINGMDVCIVREDVAFVKMDFSRIRSDGTPIPPADRVSLYVVHQSNDLGWRIVANYGYDASAEITCTDRVE